MAGTITYGPPSALSALLSAVNAGQGSLWPAGPHAQYVAWDTEIGTELMPNPTVIPSTLQLQGSPPINVPGATVGQVLTSDASGNFTPQAPVSALGTPLAGPSGSQPTVFRQPDGSVLVIPLAFYSLSGDDNTWLTSGLSSASVALAGSPSTYLGGVGQVGGRLVLWPYAQYSPATTVVIPPGTEFRGSSGTVLTYSGTGPCLQTQGNQIGNQVIQGVGTRIIGVTVDGTNVSGSAMAGGIEIGGQYDILLDYVTVSNFTSTGTDNASNYYGGYFPLGAYGISVCNRNTLTEKIIFRNVTINNCGTPNLTTTPPNQAGGAGIQVVHPIGGSTSGSAMYAFMTVHFAQQPGQNCLVLAKEAQLYYCSVTMKGNMFSPSSGNNGAAAIVLGVGSQQGYTTVASGSNGGQIANIATWSSPAAGHLAVASTTSLPSSGTVLVAASGSTTAIVTYTGVTGGNTLTGCAYVSGSPSGTVSTGNTVGGGWTGHLSLGVWDVNIEATNNAGGTTRPYTIWFGANPDNTINNSRGYMRFASFRPASSSPNFTTQATAASPSMQFSGQIWGDQGLAAATAPVASPAASGGVGTTYTNNGNDAVVYVWGGTVTSIVVGNGNTTQTLSITSGAITLKMNNTIQINWTSQPSWAWVTDVVNG